ncbi:hypothetical protein ABZ801_01815 [Actinomadura sp. NPDC047616]
MITSTPTKAADSTKVSPTSLLAALRETAAKREADLIRFRTCCADPRASK